MIKFLKILRTATHRFLLGFSNGNTAEILKLQVNECETIPKGNPFLIIYFFQSISHPKFGGPY